MNKRFEVTGMTCSACSSRVEKAVSQLEGAQDVSVNLLTNSMSVTFEEDRLSEAEIIAAVEKAGYGVRSQETGRRKQGITGTESGYLPESPMAVAKEQAEEIRKRLMISFLFLVPLMYIAMGHMINLPLPSFLEGQENSVSFGLAQFLLCLPVLYVNRNYFEKGFRNLFHLAPNMDSLIAMGSSAALVYGVFAIFRMSYGLGQQNMELVSHYHGDLYFESSAMILALITLGKYFEARSKGKTSQALDHLIQMVPKQAVVIREGRELQIPTEEVELNDVVAVKPGSTIPVDGVVIEGNSSVDESSITGESIPVYKTRGDLLTGATINKSGYLKMRATKVGENTVFAQIIHLVEEASASKAPIAKLADKIAGVFVPIVIGISILTGIVWIVAGADFEFALSSAICVLVISCPCALGLATPVAIMVGTGKGAENGILIKSGEALETAHDVNCVVFDKTGTITEGKPKVTDVISMVDEKTLLKVAGGLEEKSEHPLSEAVMEYVEKQGYEWSQVQEFEAIPGQGVIGRTEEGLVFAGNSLLMKERGVIIKDYQHQMDQLSDQGKTPLLFAREQEVIGIIAVADTVKASSARAIAQLKKMGIRVVMLTGDNERTARGVGIPLGLDEIVAQVLPGEKEQVVERLQKDYKVAMVGDGINDAPALVKADVGIAIGSGTDVAVESADLILMRNDLMDVVNGIALSKAVIRNIKENLFWAFFYNSLGIPLAAGVFYPLWGWQLSPMFGAAAMGFSSVFVVSNALRLKFFKGEKIIKEVPNKMVVLKIEGMMCQHCVGHVTEALTGIKGVNGAEVNLEQKEARVQTDVAPEILVKAVEEAGYKVTEVI